MDPLIAAKPEEDYGFYIKVEGGYRLKIDLEYYSKRYDKKVSLKKGMFSDGATGAFDIFSRSWWVHDELCNTGKWADGTRCTNWQASTVLGDILFSEWRLPRSVYWWIATFFKGGGKARENGMILLKKEQANGS